MQFLTHRTDFRLNPLLPPINATLSPESSIGVNRNLSIKSLALEPCSKATSFLADPWILPEAQKIAFDLDC